MVAKTSQEDDNNNGDGNNNNDDDDDDDRIERSKSRFFFIFFYTISSLRRELCPTRRLKWPGLNRVQITSDSSSAYHVQHIGRPSRGTCRVPCGTKGKLSC